MKLFKDIVFWRYITSSTIGFIIALIVTLTIDTDRYTIVPTVWMLWVALNALFIAHRIKALGGKG